ncbi:uncharacterized protein BO97DRAFT_407092 [Aspergillus homomorphus CBS 101889]|uniref:Uncharacterized protein n=1 Tax=Aspergillus homomorphus (strain CBS 101889) TaxID=1450537 RepID=A0A395HVC0_ASPHC|nr:hypothetical protein BO97DRAFT_407092 [Aspergillus homomorphus CBS 101889]RAL10174.1 hypothetical protein BO97DRAFT_407092 [Aspergillus homomorphus CBS 101889]
MAVIWGLDLKEIQWSKFKSSYMFNRIYHLRRTKMIVYQLAMILCVCSESTGTAALSDYVDQQNYIEHHHPGVSVHNNDFIGAASYNIFVGVAVATIFGAAFFFDLFWPERHESKSVHLAWKICSVIVSIMMLSSALTMTVITATSSVKVHGTDAAGARKFWSESSKKPSFLYRTNPKAIASVVLAWPGWVATVASTLILFASHKHDDVHGPKSNYGREMDGEKVPEPETTGGLHNTTLRE